LTTRRGESPEPKPLFVRAELGRCQKTGEKLRKFHRLHRKWTIHVLYKWITVLVSVSDLIQYYLQSFMLHTLHNFNYLLDITLSVWCWRWRWYSFCFPHSIPDKTTRALLHRW